MVDMFFLMFLVIFFMFIITALIVRWLFRINEIVSLLKEIARLLDVKNQPQK